MRAACGAVPVAMVTMLPPEIMVDLDEVIYPFMGVFWRWLLSVHPNPIPFVNDTWHFHRELGIDDETFHRYLIEFGNQGGYNAPVAPLTSMHPIVEMWDHGHRIHVVTARPDVPHVVADTKAWLARHGMPYDTLTFSEDKTAFLRFVRSTVTYAVDDKPSNVHAMRAAGVRAVLFAQPHNLKQRDGLHVVRNLDQFRTGVAERKWSS